MILVASIIVGYDLDFAHCIEEEIHKNVLKWSTSILFSCLIYRLCTEVGPGILPYMDMIIEV